MCGITGFADFTRKTTQASLQQACDTLAHRGPDDQDALLIDLPDILLGLGHRRLSVLDVSAAGHQPMFSADNKVVLVFNGEIYNFREIRKTLEALGQTFHSDADTEVVIGAYRQWGMACLDRFIGMFAFVLVDTEAKKIFLVRDRAGVKPLYYQYKDGRLLFASELKALAAFQGFRKELAPEAVSLFFKYGYIRAPYSIFRDTYKLQPGHYAVLDLSSRQLAFHRYWSILDHYQQPPLVLHEEEALAQLEERMISAFCYRLVSDVPVGMFLSGGYDSSLVTAILQRHSNTTVKTFTIGFQENKYNEAPYAKKVAEYLGTEHHEQYCTTSEAQALLPQLPFHFDEPFGDASAIPTMLVSKFAREQVTVALSADGGDELFAGYNRYDQLQRLHQWSRYIPGALFPAGASLLRVVGGKNATAQKIAAVLSRKDPIRMADAISRHFTGTELSALLPQSTANDILLITPDVLPKQCDRLNTILAADFCTYLPDDILVKVDRASMYVSLEGREPMLDHRLAEFTARLPASWKYRDGQKKYLLRVLAHNYLPRELMERPKMGFGLPVHEWLRGDLRPLLEEYVRPEKFDADGPVNWQYAATIRERFLEGYKGYENKAWLLLMFALWQEKWMD